MITLHTRASLLSDIYATAGYAHGRATQTLLQSLIGRTPSALGDLGALQRACVWENITLKAALSSRGIDVSAHPHDVLSTWLSGGGATTVPDGQVPTPAAERTGDNGTPSGAATNGATPAEPSTSTAPAALSATEKEEQPRDKNAKGLKHIVTQIPSSLSPFFQCK